eukprot:62872-Pelagomonas_calceolata.AAC.2
MSKDKRSTNLKPGLDLPVLASTMKTNSTEKLILEMSYLRLSGYHHGSQKKQKQSDQPSASACKNLKSSKGNQPHPTQSGPGPLPSRETRIQQTGSK